MKTTKVLGFLLSLVLLTATACEYFKSDHLQPTDCKLDTPFWLRYGKSIECEELNLTFSGEVEDSRCPLTVTCVWAGRVDVELQVGDELISLGLPDDEQLGRSKAVVGNYEIELLEVFPAPVAEEELPNGSYRIKLNITNL